VKYNIDKIIVPRFEEANGFYTTAERSKLMSKIKGKNTIPEVMFRKELWKLGIRYRIHNRKLPGNPDIVISKFRIVIFIDGEFWHGYNWKEKKKKIKTNRDFWIPKIERNMQRDLENALKLEILGYKVFRFWEHKIKKDINGCIASIKDYIKSNNKKTAAVS
jgi:DNA mismatch endonuclease (patch repair protein)